MGIMIEPWMGIVFMAEAYNDSPVSVMTWRKCEISGCDRNLLGDSDRSLDEDCVGDRSVTPLRV